VDSGALPARRLGSWRLLQREAAWMATRTDARVRSEQAKAWRSETRQRRRTGQSRP
jgi:ribosome biogenesis GTPase / thiamine phosphate phosphatase